MSQLLIISIKDFHLQNQIIKSKQYMRTLTYHHQFSFSSPNQQIQQKSHNEESPRHHTINRSADPRNRDGNTSTFSFAPGHPSMHKHQTRSSRPVNFQPKLPKYLKSSSSHNSCINIFLKLLMIFISQQSQFTIINWHQSQQLSQNSNSHNSHFHIFTISHIHIFTYRTHKYKHATQMCFHREIYTHL